MKKRLNWFNYLSPWLLQTLIWPATRPFLMFFAHLEVKGVRHLKALEKGKGVIFAANHGSELDVILLPASLPFLSRFMPIFYVSRENKFYQNAGPVGRIFYGGFFFKLWGAHPVQVGLRDYETSLASHIEMLEQGKSVYIFPEGGIPKEGETKKAKGGIAYLSERTKLPIVPVVISDGYKVSWAQMFSRKRHITLEFLPPISAHELEATAPGIGADGIPDYATRAEVLLAKIQSHIQAKIQ